MRGNRGADTRPEIALRSALHRLGLRFRKNTRPLGKGVRADIVFPRERIAVFVDGCYWHRCPDHGTRPRKNSAYWEAKLDGNVARDRANDELLRAAHWVVVRVWEHDEPADAAARIRSLVLARRAVTAQRAR